MRLSIVIPVWNDAEPLDRLLGQLAAMPFCAEIVVVDDASEQQVGLTLARAAELAAVGITLKLERLPVQSGAGRARNRGLEVATGDYVLFFDADDAFTPAICDIVSALAGQTFDMCLFRHRITDGTHANVGPALHDQRLWIAAGLGSAAGSNPTSVTGAAALYLCRTTAYPWNKVFRTAFLRDAGVRCGETPVHNDIALHWGAFLAARTILADRRIGAVHAERPGGGRLTNRTGPERIALFDALAPVVAQLTADPAALPFLVPFLGFAADVATWGESRIAPPMRPDFRAARKAFLLNQVPAALFDLACLADPALGRRLLALAGTTL